MKPMKKSVPYWMLAILCLHVPKNARGTFDAKPTKLVQTALTGLASKYLLDVLAQRAVDRIAPLPDASKKSAEVLANRALIEEYAELAKSYVQRTTPELIKHIFKNQGASGKQIVTLMNAYQTGFGLIPHAIASLGKLRNVLSDIFSSPQLSYSDLKYPIKAGHVTALTCGLQDPYCLKMSGDAVKGMSVSDALSYWTNEALELTKYCISDLFGSGKEVLKYIFTTDKEIDIFHYPILMTHSTAIACPKSDPLCLKAYHPRPGPYCPPGERCKRASHRKTEPVFVPGVCSRYAALGFELALTYLAYNLGAHVVPLATDLLHFQSESAAIKIFIEMLHEYVESSILEKLTGQFTALTEKIKDATQETSLEKLKELNDSIEYEISTGKDELQQLKRFIRDVNKAAG